MELTTLLFLFLAGLCIGSFLGVIIDRIPRSESIAKGRSYCESCKKTLSFVDLVPVISFIFLRGKCRFCRTKLSWYYPLFEITTGILFVLTGIFFGSTIEIAFYLFIISVFIAIFFIDLKSGIIPFSLIIAGTIVWSLHIFLYTPSQALALLFSALGAFLFFLVLFLSTRGRGIGFGDVVYAFLMGLVLGFPQIVIGLYVAFVSGAIVALILVALKHKKIKGATIAFGPFLVLGTLVSLFWGENIFRILLAYLT